MKILARLLGWCFRRMRDVLALVGLLAVGGASILAMDASPRERALVVARLRAYVSAPDQDTPVGPILEDAPPVVWPVRGRHRVSSGYGWRVHPVLRTRRFHTGVDIAVPVGTPVLAALDGEVVATGVDDVNGNYIVLAHRAGIRTSYGHLSAIDARVGDRVDRGEVVARSGNTGRSTGPHLHFTARVDGQLVDPRRFPRQDASDALAARGP